MSRIEGWLLFKLSVGMLTMGALVGGASIAQAQPGDLTARNREIVSKFSDLFYTRHDVKAAFEAYVAKDYIQHSPGIADSRDAAIAVLTPMFSRPGFIVHVRHVFVDGDYATVMVHADRQGPTGGAIIDVYRLQGGKIVEHWDVNEIIPAKASNPHPFF